MRPGKPDGTLGCPVGGPAELDAPKGRFGFGVEEKAGETVEVRDPNRWIGSVALAGALGFVVYVLGGLFTAVLRAPPPGPEELAPPFRVESLNGAVTSRDELSGHALLLDFWTTTCVGCIGSLNRLNRMQEDYQDDGFRVVSLNQDANSRRDQVATVATQRELVFPVWFGAGSRAAAEAYRIGGFPTVVLVRPDGRVQSVHSGPVAESRLRSEIEAMLPGPREAPPSWSFGI